MNVSRLTAIAFSLILLSACGGGGGGGGSGGAGAGIGGGAGGGGGVQPEPTEDLPAPLVSNATSARNLVSGQAPEERTSDDIENELESRASGAEPLFNDIVNLSTSTERSHEVKCDDTGICMANITSGANPAIIRFPLGDFSNVPQFRDLSLTRYRQEYRPVMTHMGVELVQAQAAGLSSGGSTPFRFQSYGGWLKNSVFAVQTLTLGHTGNESVLLTSYSFGDTSGRNPAGAGELQWNGVVVGRDKGTDDVIHGVVEVVYNLNTPNLLDSVVFRDVKNLTNQDDNGSNVTFGNNNKTNLSFPMIPLTNGSFESTDSTDGDIKGAFYGENHEEVGGIFDGHNIIGAFGATK